MNKIKKAIEIIGKIKFGEKGKKPESELTEEKRTFLKMKKNNIYSKAWFAMFFIPCLLFVGRGIWLNEYDRFVYEGFIIITLGLVLQLTFYHKVSMSTKSIHLIYIVCVSLLTMFISYFLHRYVDLNADFGIFKGKGGNDFLIVLIQIVILYVIKMFLGIFLEGKGGKIYFIKIENENLKKEVNYKNDLIHSVEDISDIEPILSEEGETQTHYFPEGKHFS